VTAGRSVPLQAAVLVASDRAARGERADATGPEVRRALEAAGVAVLDCRVLPDDREALAGALRSLADVDRLDLVVVAGGTGLGPRDVTPEAIRDVVDREVPGLAEAMRQEGRKKTPFAMLSRSLAGVRGRTLILGVPGSPRAARESLEVVLPVLGHARAMLAGGDHPPDPPGGRDTAPSAVPVVAVVGWSGSGKTTLIEKLLAELARRGYRVATLKHDAHGFEMDHPGKDTWRHRQAGAAAVAITAPGRLALLATTAGEVDPGRAVALLAEAAGSLDLVLIEGYKGGPYPKIAVHRAALEEAPCCLDDPLLLAVASDVPLTVAAPCLPLADAAAVCDLLERRVLAPPR